MDEHEVPADRADHGVVRNFAYKGLRTELGMGSERTEPAGGRFDEPEV